MLLISVIIPTYNDGDDVAKAIQSVFNQEAPEKYAYELEIIVIDDASEEQKFQETLKLANKDKRIQLIRCEKNGGPAEARNIGLKQAKGNIIAFIDADDLWPKNKLKLLLPFVLEENYSIAGGKVKYLMNEGRELDIDAWEDEENRLTHVHLGALLVKRDIFDQGYFFNKQLRYSEDVDWWMRLREDKQKIIILEDTTLEYRIHDTNMTKQTTVHDLNLLKVLHLSLKRRKERDVAPVIPQLRDFRKFRNFPLISVIIPIFNGMNTIQKAIQSIKNQNYPSIEIIAIDDGSSDGSCRFITENHPEIKLICQKNKGVTNSRNIGIEASNGELIAFLDQDGEWLPGKLTEQWEQLKNDPYCTWVTCLQQLMWGKDVQKPTFLKPEHDEPHRSFIPSSLLIRKHTLLDMKGFDEKLEVGSDLDLIARLRKGNYPEANVEKVLLYKWFF